MPARCLLPVLPGRQTHDLFKSPGEVILVNIPQFGGNFGNAQLPRNQQFGGVLNFHPVNVNLRHNSGMPDEEPPHLIVGKLAKFGHIVNCPPAVKLGFDGGKQFFNYRVAVNKLAAVVINIHH